MATKLRCPIHGDKCPGDDGGFFIDGNHPDDMFSVQDMDPNPIQEAYDRAIEIIDDED